MKHLKLLLLGIFSILISCGNNNTKAGFLASNAPLSMILQEIIGTKGNVEYIVPTGASPHTYTPKPSDIIKINNAKAFFYISKNIDAFVKNINPKTSIEVIRLIPKNSLLFKAQYVSGNSKPDPDEPVINDTTFNYEKIDPHFWTDPLTIKALVPFLVDTLSKIDPENASYYKTNGADFIAKLELLDKQISNLIQNIHTKPIFLFHPSFLYYIRRYNLTFGGTIEQNPGQESSPASLTQLINNIKNSGVKAIFSEPQLSDKPTKVIAEQAHVNVYLLDPLGGIPGRANYNDLILYNTRILKEALE
jgi:ABC-type Zn uptake system ZnuABC Zn-binding protein ZnuA